MVGSDADLLGSATPSDDEVTLFAGPEGEQPEVEHLRFERGLEVGRYVILDEAGAGGMGVVYRAYDPNLRREVALKVLHMTSVVDTVAPGSQDRLLREAQAMAQVSHPNVVPVHDAGTMGDRVYVAMEYVPAQTADEWLKAEPRTWKQIVRLFIQAGRGLHAAHEVGIVHRDFKPANLLVSETGRARVTDFGLARALDSFEPESVETTRDTSELLVTPLTQVGAVVGTPAYMAPEQHMGQKVDARGDQFSFCVALFEALYETRPFAGGTVQEVGRAKIKGEVVDPPNPKRVPTRVRRVIDRGLSRRASERWPDMKALLRALKRAQSSVVRRQAPWLAAAAVVVAGGAAAGGTWVVTGEARRCNRGAKRMAEVWNDHSRDAVRGALTSTEQAYAGDTTKAVVVGLDTYAAGWADAFRDACQATHERGEQSERLLDLRMTCLGERRQELAALVAVLQTADEQALRRAVAAVEGLPEISRCSASATLERRHDDEPDDAASRATVAEVRQILADAGAADAIGRYRDAAQQLEPALVMARSVGHARTEAQVLVALAGAVNSAGDSQRALELGFEAINAAVVAGDDELAAKASVSQVFVLGYELRRAEPAERWAGLAKALLDAAGVDDEAHAALINARAVTTAVAGDLAKARPMFEEALRLRQRDDPEALNTATLQANLGAVLMQAGDYEAAFAHVDHALSLKEARLGPLHPEVLLLRSDAASGRMLSGEYELAERRFREVLDLQIETMGEDHPDVASTLNSLGTVVRWRGREDEAAQIHRRALAIREKVRGPKHVDVAQSLGNLATALTAAGETDEAEALLRRALQIRIEIQGSEHAEVAHVLEALGSALEDGGKPTEARDHYRRAVVIVENTVGADHPRLVTLRRMLGEVELDLGDRNSALQHLEAAVEGAGADPADPFPLAKARFSLAKLIVDDDPDRAVKLATLARDALREGQSPARYGLDEIEAWLESRG